MKSLYKLDNINLNYHVNGSDIKVLKNINFVINKNERVAIIGESGSGKTSLLMLMSGLENPTTGSIFFDNEDFSKISEKKKTQIRKKKIGLIFQQFYLIPNYTALENVMFPMQINQIHDEKKKANSILSDVGLAHRKNNLPSELSGGEQQRACVARSLIKDPDIILADEPTGNLDPVASFELIKLFEEISKDGTSVLMASHNYNLIKGRGHRIVEMQNGSIRQ